MDFSGLLHWRAREILKATGVPSHDTFSRVFGLLKPEVFEKTFRRSMAASPRPMGSSSRGWWPSMARHCAAPTNAVARPRRCIWSTSSRWRRAWPWCSRKRPVATRRPAPWKCWSFSGCRTVCHRRCAALQPRLCQCGAATRRRLCPCGQGQPWALVQGGCAAICAVGQAQQRCSGRAVQPRSARSAACHRHAQHQPSGAPQFS